MFRVETGRVEPHRERGLAVVVSLECSFRGIS